MTTELSHSSAAAGATQAALDALECQIAVLTAAGDVVLVNEAWRRMAASDVPCATRVPVGSNYLRACNESGVMSQGAREAAAGLDAILSRRTRHFSVEYSCQAHGKEQWFQMDATACDVCGSLHAVVVHRSITWCRELQERVRAQAERLLNASSSDEHQQTERELRALLARKEEFLATLLHELRNPLAPIANALELLGRRAHDPESVGRARGIIQRQVRQVTRLVDDLFDIALSKRQNVETQRTRVDIADVIVVAVEAAQPFIDARRHRFSASVPPNRYVVRADPVRLAQVLTNLLINAAKYTPFGGEISVVPERTLQDLLVHVRDNGVGIAPEYLASVFELYAQAAKSEKSGSGLGIGLAVARELMRLQGGSITARSKGLGCGSEFTISLPLAHNDSA